MGVCLPAPVRLARSPRRVRAVPCEAAAGGWARRGGLDRLTKGRARGGRARLTPARPLWGGGLCCVGRRVSGERKGRGGLSSDNQAVGWVLGSWRESALTLSARSAGEIADRASGRRVSDRARRPFFSEVRNPRNEGAKCCAPSPDSAFRRALHLRQHHLKSLVSKQAALFGSNFP